MQLSGKVEAIPTLAETEGARRATGVSANEPSRPGSRVPGGVDPEVPAQPRRRRFTAEYKLRVLQEADRCKKPGEIGALLRREGLYSSQLALWRRQREHGLRQALRGKKRGRKARALDPRVKKLERENTQLRQRLQQAELLLELQKKASELLGIPLRRLQESESD